MSDRPHDESTSGDSDETRHEQGNGERSTPQAGANQQRDTQSNQQQTVQTGPSIGDIFNRQDTMREIKGGVVLFAVLGVGIGLGMFGITNSVSGGAGGFAGALSLFSLVAIPIVVGVVGALVVSLRQNEELGGVANNLVYGTVGVTAFVGTVVTFVIAWILAGVGGGGVSFDGVFGPMILGALGAAVTGAGTVWTHRGYLADTGGQHRPTEGYQQPQD